MATKRDTKVASSGKPSPTEELSKGDVSFSLGLYRFQLNQEDYLTWIDTIKQDVGFDKPSVIKELKRRLDV